MTDEPTAPDLAARLTGVKARIRAAESASGRFGAGVRLLVATKTADADAECAAVRAGARLVGESRMQELDAKGAALRNAGAKIHVIGQLQRNKASVAVHWADCVQTVDSLRLAERLSRLCVEAERKSVSYTHLRAHETKANLVCRLLLE